MSTISQTRAICFSKNRLSKKTTLNRLSVGKRLDNEGFDDNTLLSQKRTLKTLNSKRRSASWFFIMDEMLYTG